MADYLPLHPSGKAFTRTTSAAVTAGQLVSVTGSGTVGPSALADVPWCGVAAFDAASGQPVTVFSGGIQRVAASGTVTQGQLVHAGAAGTVVTHTNGTIDYAVVGVALTTAVGPALVEVQFDR